MSSRAAWRLETLGFAEVYDYVPGKADWFGAGLGREGTKAGVTRVGDLVDREVPTCGLEEKVGDIRGRLSGEGTCVVVNPRAAVLGLVRAGDLGSDDGQPVEKVMVEGPSTLRPNAAAAELAARLEPGHFRSYLVTTPDGLLIGLLRGPELERWYLEGGRSEG